MAGPEPPPRFGLTVASWDLATAPNLMPSATAPPEAATKWRTSFGSERGSAPAQTTPAIPAAIDADAVLLQGVTDIRRLRRIFPARQWRIVLSREAVTISGSPNADPETEVQPRLSGETTAVAVRFRSGLRVTAREVRPAVLQQPEGAEPAPGESMATAVRISTGSRAAWLLSYDMAATCPPEGACPAPTSLDAWRDAKLAAGDGAIVAGRLRPGASASTPCSGPPLVATFVGTESQRATPQEQSDRGCLATLVITPAQPRQHEAPSGTLTSNTDQPHDTD